jgi:hypothetical protein
MGKKGKGGEEAGSASSAGTGAASSVGAFAMKNLPLYPKGFTPVAYNTRENKPEAGTVGEGLPQPAFGRTYGRDGRDTTDEVQRKCENCGVVGGDDMVHMCTFTCGRWLCEDCFGGTEEDGGQPSNPDEQDNVRRIPS